MAKLKDTVINGSLDITENIILQTNKAIYSTHPKTGELTNMFHMSNYGNTVIGYGNYVNQSGNSHIYGNDIVNYVASAGNVNYRPYCRAGDSLDFIIRTSGYITNGGADVTFTVPINMPIIGNPVATATSNKGFVFRQGNNYAYGSSASGFITPASYNVLSYYSQAFTVVATFNNTINVTNNETIGIYWDGRITLS